MAKKQKKNKQRKPQVSKTKAAVNNQKQLSAESASSNKALAQSTKMASASWLIITLLLFISTSFLSWQILRVQDFNYGLWYEAIDIDATIKKYGPQNRNRDLFEITDKPEHERLFSEIVTSIHNEGEGLREITYRSPKGKEIATLLTEPEVIHLQDVAALVDVYFAVGFIAVLLSAIAILATQKLQIQLPPFKNLAISWLAFIGGILIITMIIGPVKVFYQLHIWIFPEDHEWFFYYQDSLMTLMMKAPELFGYIAAAWGTLTVLLLFAVLWGLRHFNNKKTSSDL